ncbi:response regulator [Cohnella ginsengisoli]|uniref:Response regulator n=1 Tax=Cohnella ginsengisoli TaxID=425004 RepID=A0A9X4KHN5_9BACL|nr:response regulator [Cohnella ginsengisoli]MDG0792357.1 response regulator [Cohnella ginsengisoli]
MNVLIVDDEDTILKGLAALISELPEAAAGGEIYGALNGAEALDILSSRPVDLVITDIHMPGIDGLSLTGTIRYRHPEIPVVLLTGYNDSSYMQQAIRLKAEDYLFKPVKKGRSSEHVPKNRPAEDDRPQARPVCPRGSVRRACVSGEKDRRVRSR